jgi:hypothetical protein
LEELEERKKQAEEIWLNGERYVKVNEEAEWNIKIAEGCYKKEDYGVRLYDAKFRKSRKKDKK